MVNGEPKQYLSRCYGEWTVVSGGQILCPMRPERAQAEAVARMFRIQLPSMFWDGDAGEWVDDAAAPLSAKAGA